MATSPAALAAEGNTSYVLLKTRSYDGRSVPCLLDASGSNVQTWLQALYAFMNSCKPVDGVSVADVFFKKDDTSDNAQAITAALSILTLGLCDRYYTECMDDTQATDGETVSSAVDMGAFTVQNIDAKKLFARAAKLGALATVGMSVDDLEIAPIEYFDLGNSDYDASGTFLATVNKTYSWLTTWKDRMTVAGTAPTAERMLSHMRIAIKKVAKELYTDKMIEFTQIGGDSGMLKYLRRLAQDKDKDGLKPSHALALPDLRGPPRGGRGRGRGRGNDYGRARGQDSRSRGRGGGRQHDKASPRQENTGGRTCHGCGSIYHLVRDCSQVPPRHRKQAHALVMSNSYTDKFWQKADNHTTDVDEQLYVSDGYGGYKEYRG